MLVALPPAGAEMACEDACELLGARLAGVHSSAYNELYCSEIFMNSFAVLPSFLERFVDSATRIDCDVAITQAKPLLESLVRPGSWLATIDELVDMLGNIEPLVYRALVADVEIDADGRRAYLRVCEN